MARGAVGMGIMVHHLWWCSKERNSFMRDFKALAASLSLLGDFSNRHA